MGCSRREFLKLMAASTAGTVLFAGCRGQSPELLMESPASIPEDLVSGSDDYYATLCRQCTAGCGILVRVMEGRAKKIEGNPAHPINGGKHCARAEAALQGLYHPDRLRGPMRRTGPRGSGKFEPITWDEALNELVAHLRDLYSSGRGSEVVAMAGPLRGHTGLILDRFMSAFGGQRLTMGPLDEGILRAAIKRAFGQDILPDFSIEEAQYIVSFGSDFLGTWLSPVRYGRMYGEFRQGRPDRGTLVQVEPRFSSTAACADLWVPIKPGTEGLLALSMAQVIAEERLANPATIQAMTGGTGNLEGYRPEAVSGPTGVDAGLVRQLARDFATKRPALAIGGGPAGAQTNGLFNLQAIYALNFLAGDVGAVGGLRFNPPAPIPDIPASAPGAAFADWQSLAGRLRTNSPSPVSALLVHGANPVYALPQLRFEDAMNAVPFIASFSGFLDETSAMADLILPDHHFLEAWGDDVPEPGPGYPVVTFQQPVVMPMGNTRNFTDVLLTAAEELGGAVHQALPWNTTLDALKDGASKLQGLNRGSVVGPDPDLFWVQLLQAGCWWGAWREAHATSSPPVPLPGRAQLPAFGGRDGDLYLIPFASNSLLEGQVAHLPWLQALPDPTTTVVWQSWAEINPGTAARLGISTGDLVRLSSSTGSVDVPCYIHPAVPPDVVAVPLGQGHRGFTRYASGRGVNPLAIVDAITDVEAGGLAWAAARVKVEKTGRRANLPRFEGTVPAYQLEDAPVVPTVRS